MEETSNKIVRHLYNNLVDPKSGENACALIRFYKTHSYDRLDTGLQEFARGVMGKGPDSPDMKCLTMLGTAGEEPQWNARANSQWHKAIPLASAEFEAQIPMMAQLFNQFGLDMGAVLRPDHSIIGDKARRTYNPFHIADAMGSPYIPAQDDFVVPYGIKSVLGFGGILSTGAFSVIIIFSKVAIPRETAENFRDLAAKAKEAVEPFVATAVFA